MKYEITIRQLLNEELECYRYVCGMEMVADDLFNKEKVMQWISKLIGDTHAQSLKKLMEATTVERLGHAAATYLLGVAIRNRLQIPLDLLPKLMTNGIGDGFHYFWALICLCHDLGYRFENNSGWLPEMRESMDDPSQRKGLLGITHDMMDLVECRMSDLVVDENSANSRWIREAIRLINGYDAYRREKKHTGEGAKIDHGIAGAALLYDLLRKEYDHMKRTAERGRQCANELRHVEAANMIEGVARHETADRFLENSLIMASTVGRHNMWLAEEKDEYLYEKYELKKLWRSNPAAKVRADSKQEQMLFFLDFMDTIDPVKGIYLREKEKRKTKILEALVKQNAATSLDPLTQAQIGIWESEISLTDAENEEMEDRKNFLLDQVKIRFVGDYICQKNWEYRWGDSLTYRKMELFVEQDPDLYFSNYVQSTLNLSYWLATRAPEPQQIGTREIECADGKTVNMPVYSQVAFYLPSCRGQGNLWPFGITEQEVDALLLYEGCGVPGKYSEFDAPAEAYQTFNLLMMPGMQGEQVRILAEKQYPRSVYIRQWQKTINVMLDIFTAQCKYAVRQVDGARVQDNLWRSDRKLNLQLMLDYGGSFAFTSTSRDSFKEDFLTDKQNPQILHIKLGKNVPFFDYEGFFGDKYVFSSEREVLLPPLLKMDYRADGYWKSAEGDMIQSID